MFQSFIQNSSVVSFHRVPTAQVPPNYSNCREHVRKTTVDHGKQEVCTQCKVKNINEINFVYLCVVVIYDVN